MIMIIASGNDGLPEPPPRTLAGYAARLKAHGRNAPRGGDWRPNTLARVFRAYEVSPKQLYEAYLPQPFAPRSLPESIDINEVLAHACERENDFGSWHSSLMKKPTKGQKVRLRESGEGLAAGTILEVCHRRGSVVVAFTPARLNEPVKLRLVDLETWVPRRQPKDD